MAWPIPSLCSPVGTSVAELGCSARVLRSSSVSKGPLEPWESQTQAVLLSKCSGFQGRRRHREQSTLRALAYARHFLPGLEDRPDVWVID